MVPIIQSIDELRFYFCCSEQSMCHGMSRRMQAICVINLPHTARRQKNKPI